MGSELSRGPYVLVGALGCHTSCRAGEELRSVFVLCPVSPYWGTGGGGWEGGQESRPGLSPLGRGLIPAQPFRS